MAPQEGVEGVALLVSEFDGKGLGSTQGRVRKEGQGMGIGLCSNGMISTSQFGPAVLAVSSRSWVDPDSYLDLVF
jgi:hypothetical protein